MKTDTLFPVKPELEKIKFKDMHVLYIKDTSSSTGYINNIFLTYL